MSSTPQDAGEIAARLYGHITDPDNSDAMNISYIKAAIEADRQAERDRHAAEINRQRQDARLIALEEAANLACSECRDGVAVAEVRPGMFRHHYGGDEYGRCEARRIHRLIEQEAANVA